MEDDNNGGAGGESAGLTGMVADPPAGPPPADSGQQSSGSTWSGIYGEGGVRESFLESIPADNKATKALFDKYKTDKDLESGLNELGQLRRMKGFGPLPDDATDAEKALWQKNMRDVNNMPSDPKDYRISAPEGMSEDDFEKLELGGYYDIANKHNISPAALSELLQHNLERGAQSEEQAKAAEAERLNAELDEVRREYGGASDDVLRKAEAVGNLLGFPAGKIVTKEIVDLLHKAGQYIGSDKLPAMGESNVATQTQDAQTELDAMMTNPEHKYYRAMSGDNTDSAHVAEAMKHYRQLIAVVAESKRAQNRRPR